MSKRKYSVDYILNEAGKRAKFEEYIKEVEVDEEKNEKFKLTRFKVKYEFNKFEDATNPEESLRNCFKQTIDKAIAKSNEEGFDPDRIGIVISSVNLDPDIVIHFTKLTENTVDAIFNRFLIVQQSKAKEQSLLGEPFTVDVTLINKNSLPLEQRTAGNGRREVCVRHNIDEKKLIKVNNPDNYCLFYSLIIMKMYVKDYMEEKRINKDQFYNFSTNISVQKKLVENLMKACKINRKLSSYDAETYCPIIEKHWEKEYGKVFKIFIFSEYGTCKPVYMSNIQEYKHAILLYHKDNHFSGIRTLHQFFNQSQYYCFSCLAPYQSPAEHNSTCKSRCLNCTRIGPEFPCKKTTGYLRFCTDCHKSFINPECFDWHKNKKVCERTKKCQKCGVVYNINFLKRKGFNKHICLYRYCKSCDTFHQGLCYIQPLKPTLPKPYRLAFFDFECTQHRKIITKTGKTKFVHEPNFIGLIITCTLCIENGRATSSLKNRKPCKICGQFRTISFAPFEFSHTRVEKKYTNEDPLQSFVDFLLHGLNKKFKTMCYSHNGGGRYDNVILFKKLFAKGLCPSMIRNGNKLYEINVSSDKLKGITHTVFRDSYNIASFRLGNFVKAFGLSIEEKQHFPHKYNRPENYNITLPHLPDILYYSPDSMKIPDRQKLLKWHSENYNEQFNLCEKLAEYCMSDCEILTQGMLKLREEFLEISQVKYVPEKKKKKENEAEDLGSEDSFDDEECSDAETLGFDDEETDGENEEEETYVGLDILEKCRTIASAAMQIYRLKYLKPNTLARTPHNSYNTLNNNQSELALKYLKILEERWGVDIQTAKSHQGEYKVPGTNFSLDGFIKRNGKRNVGIEIHGCAWHACEKCFKDPQEMLPSGKTVEKVREQHKLRMLILKSIANLKIKEFWECDIRNELDSNSKLKKKFNNIIITTPNLKLRDALVGGRTQPVRLFFNSTQNAYGHKYKIRYLDFTSLYPWAQTQPYPMGHPDVISIPKEARNVNWRRPDQIKYNGFIKGVIRGPRQLKGTPAVLPTRLDDRLCFSTCRTCQLNYVQGGKIQDYNCTHIEEEREFLWTGTTIELAEALRNNYVLTKIYSALDYTEFSDEIFKEYVSDFMAMKIHSTGFDPEIRTDVEKEKFIADCFEKFKIQLDKQKMKPDASRKTMSKLANNSLWGKFAENDNLTKTTTTSSPATLRKFFDDPKIQVISANMLNDEVVMITYKKQKDFIESNKTNNVAIAAWTTSRARLKLLEALQAVTRCEQTIEKSAILLYHDTDSIIYAVRDGFDDPLKYLENPLLGGLKDEYPDFVIEEYCSCGPKNYALKMKNGKGEYKHEMKIRGLTLDYSTCKKLPYELFREKCLNFGKDENVELINYEGVLRPDASTGNVYTVPHQKIFRPVVRKGIVREDDHEVMEFGRSNK